MSLIQTLIIIIIFIFLGTLGGLINRRHYFVFASILRALKNPFVKAFKILCMVNITILLLLILIIFFFFWLFPKELFILFFLIKYFFIRFLFKKLIFCLLIFLSFCVFFYYFLINYEQIFILFRKLLKIFIIKFKENYNLLKIFLIKYKEKSKKNYNLLKIFLINYKQLNYKEKYSLLFIKFRKFLEVLKIYLITPSINLFNRIFKKIKFKIFKLIYSLKKKYYKAYNIFNNNNFINTYLKKTKLYNKFLVYLKIFSLYQLAVLFYTIIWWVRLQYNFLCIPHELAIEFVDFFLFISTPNFYLVWFLLKFFVVASFLYHFLFFLLFFGKNKIWEYSLFFKILGNFYYFLN